MRCRECGYCVDCESEFCDCRRDAICEDCSDELYDADELGLNPEDDDARKYGSDRDER